MAFNPQNPNGQAVMASSAPVVIASNQSAVPISGSINQTIGTAEFAKVTDGTNTANVKAASTAAIATDPALVVAISPNNTVPVSLATNTPTLQTGANTIGSIASITTSIVPGTAATNLGKSRNLAIGATDTGVASLLLRNDALTTFGTTGNYNTAIVDQFGAMIIKDEQRHKRTYRCAFVVAPAALATDVFQIIGSATTTVEITKIIISGTQTTGGMADVYVAKRSTANTVGTFSASTNVPMISTDAAATAVGSIYTANPTVGTSIGDVFVTSVPFSAATATTLNVLTIDFGINGKPPQLVGVAQALAIRLNGVTITG